MTNEQENVTQGQSAPSSDAPLDFGAMIRNASPTLRRFVIYQGIILLVLIMLVVGTVAYRASVSLLTDDSQEAVEGVTVGEEINSISPEDVRVMTKAGVLNIRPEGAVLIRVDKQPGTLMFHFRARGKDFIRLVDIETGAVTAYDIP